MAARVKNQLNGERSGTQRQSTQDSNQMNKNSIKEQIEILARHIEDEVFDAAFVEAHARYIVELAKPEREAMDALAKSLGIDCTQSHCSAGQLAAAVRWIQMEIDQAEISRATNAGPDLLFEFGDH